MKKINDETKILINESNIYIVNSHVDTVKTVSCFFCLRFMRKHEEKIFVSFIELFVSERCDEWFSGNWNDFCDILILILKVYYFS
jgi:hypothetical protein